MSTLKSNRITEFESATDLSPVYLQHGRVRSVADAFEVAVADIGAADIILLAAVPSNSRIRSIILRNDDLDSATTITADVGLYDADGTVVDDDAYASAITDFRAAQTGVEVAFEARDIADAGNRVWEDAGETEDPGGHYYIGLTIDAAGDQAGTIAFDIEYVVD